MLRYVLLSVAMLITLAVCAVAGAGAFGVVEDVEFRAGCDGVLQRYVVGLPDGVDGGVARDVCVALHGHGSDRWQFVRDGRDECRAVRDVAVGHSMIFVSPDYRASTSWMGPKAEADVVQIIGEVKRAYRVGRVFVCGGSMGGSSALTFAALHPELVDGVVCLNGTANLIEYDQFQEAIRDSFGGTKLEALDEYKKRSAEYWPERLTMPVAITAGGKDTTAPPGSSVRLAGILERLGRRVLLIMREDGGHATNYDDTKAAFEFVIEQAATE